MSWRPRRPRGAGRTQGAAGEAPPARSSRTAAASAGTPTYPRGGSGEDAARANILAERRDHPSPGQQRRRPVSSPSLRSARRASKPWSAPTWSAASGRPRSVQPVDERDRRQHRQHAADMGRHARHTWRCTPAARTSPGPPPSSGKPCRRAGQRWRRADRVQRHGYLRRRSRR